MLVVFFVAVYIIVTVICIGILTTGLYQKNINRICKSKKRLDGKTAIVTGGTTGMGLEIAKDFAHRGARVIVACPFEEEGDNGKKLIIRSSGNENVTFEHLDLSSFASVKKFAANIIEMEERLDILVNNAGVNDGKNLTSDGLDFVMQVNYFGTVLLTLLLLPLLRRTGRPEEPARIVNTTSLFNKRGHIDIKKWYSPENPWLSYPSSKLCIALFTCELARKIHDFNVIVNVVEPGIVGTTILLNHAPIFGSLVLFLAKTFYKTPWEGAQSAIFAAVSENARYENGKCFYNCKVTMNKLSSLCFDDKLRQFLWEKTLNVLKLNDSVLFVLNGE